MKKNLKNIAFALMLSILAGLLVSGCKKSAEGENTALPDSLQVSGDSLAAENAAEQPAPLSPIPPAKEPVGQKSPNDSAKNTPKAAAPDSTANKPSPLDKVQDLINQAMGQPPASADTSRESTSDAKVAKPKWRLTVGSVFSAILLFIIALYLIRYLTNLLESLAESNRWARSSFTIKRLVPIIRILGWSTVFYIIIVNIFQLSDETLLAIGASASIAVGFASQDILKNIFGGLMLLLDRPFQVGDKVQVGSFYGEVKQIGLRTVRIETPDDNLVSIPNAEMMNEAVSNANAGQRNCQVVAEFFLPADINTVRARRIAYRAAAVSRYIYLNKPIVVIFKNEIHEGRSVLKMRLKAYVLNLRYEFPFSSEMTEIVMREFLKAGLVTAEDLDGNFYGTPEDQNQPQRRKR